MSCISPLCISLHYSRLDSHWCASSKTIRQLLALASALLALASLTRDPKSFFAFSDLGFCLSVKYRHGANNHANWWPLAPPLDHQVLQQRFVPQWHLLLAHGSMALGFGTDPVTKVHVTMSPGFHSIHFVGTAKQLKRLSENSNDLECWLGTPMVACRSSCVLLVRRPLRKRRTSSQAPGVIHGAINSVSSQHRTSCLVHGGRSTFGSTRPHCKEAIQYGFLSACAEKVWLGRYIAIGVAFCDAVLFGMFG